MLTYRRRKSGLNEASHSVFGSTGWLFADLMLAIAMAFLVANTVGAHTPHKHAGLAKEVCSPPALDRQHPVQVNLTVNPTGLAARLKSAQASVSEQVTKHPGLKGKLAGFVIIYTGNAETSSYAVTIDGYIQKVLVGLGDQHFVFRNSVYLDQQLIGGPPTQVQLQVYLFEPEQCRRVPVPPTNQGG